MRKLSTKRFIFTCVSLLALLSIVECAPNIRIQVNNDNLRNPPYVLEAIKLAAEIENNGNIDLNQSLGAIGTVAPQAQVSPTPLAQSIVPTVTIESLDNNKSLLVTNTHINTGNEKKQIESNTFELNNGAGKANQQQQQQHFPASTDEQDTLQSNSGSKDLVTNQYDKNSRKSQLEVTSSHLKRPASSANGEYNNIGTIVSPPTSGEVNKKANIGAISRTSPSVANDDSPPVVDLNKKLGVGANPDYLEVDQIMHGVTNASLVPATITRQYGHQSRTRVTLGGGYVRDKQLPTNQPEQVEPQIMLQDTGAEKVRRQVKPIVGPVERTTAGPPRELERVNAAGENSRTIQVPQRIVLPGSALDKPRVVFEDKFNRDKQDSAKIKNFEFANQTNALNNRPKDPRCPSSGWTTLEHPTACDKYFICENGLMTEHMCPNGLLFGTREVVLDHCVHRWNAVCGDKTIPNPISSPGCRWQYGIFAVQGSVRCSPDYYECAKGLFEVKKCAAPGQVYDDRTKSCQFAEKVGCANEALGDFQCPLDDQTNTYWPFPRYFLNERSLIHCVNDKPQIIRCLDSERVDPEHLHCVPISKGNIESQSPEAGASDAMLTEKRERPKQNQAISSTAKES